jgi:transitional endoplasmic reticulum ATPase
LTADATARDLCRLVKTASSLAQGARLTDKDFVSAFRHIEPSAAAEVRCDIPDVLWHDVAGLDDIKRLMRETLEWSLRHDEKFASNGVSPPRSILLSGGQGTGKTSLVRALASVIPLNFIEISCPVLTTHNADVAARMLHDCFALARRKAPCLVFLDDIDVLFEGHGSSSESESTPLPAVARLLSELDGLAMFSGVAVIASTNRPDRLTMDVLRPGRFDYAVSLPMPDHAARKKILEIHARKLPLAADVNFDRLADDTQGLSPAELANLCNRVGLMAIRQSLGDDRGGIIPPVVNAALFDQALRGRKG